MLRRPLTVVAGSNSNQNPSAFLEGMNSVDCTVLSTYMPARGGQIPGEESH